MKIDANSVARTHGAAVLRTAIDEGWSTPATTPSDIEPPPDTDSSKPPSYKFVLYKDISLSQRKDWLVRNVLGAGEFSGWYGAPGSGKSVLMNDLAGHVAAEKPWFGRPVNQGAVLYVAAERATVVTRRFAAFRKHHGLDDLPIGIMSGLLDLRSSRTSAEAIIVHAEMLAKATGIPVVLVIMETINRLLAGGDENSSKDMGALLGNVGYIQNETGAHVAAVHHVPADGASRLRGHSSLLGAVDTAALVEKLSIGRVASITKANDGPEDERLSFNLTSVELQADQDPDMTSAPVVVPADPITSQTRAAANMSPKARAGLRQLQECLADHGQEITDNPRIPTDRKAVTSADWRKRLESIGIINPDGNPRQQFQRIHVTLLNAGAIGVCDGFVWSVT